MAKAKNSIRQILRSERSAHSPSCLRVKPISCGLWKKKLLYNCNSRAHPARFMSILRIIRNADNSILMSVHGTFRTWRDIRVESVMATKADVTDHSEFIGSCPRSRSDRLRSQWRFLSRCSRYSRRGGAFLPASVAMLCLFGSIFFMTLGARSGAVDSGKVIRDYLWLTDKAVFDRRAISWNRVEIEALSHITRRVTHVRAFS